MSSKDALYSGATDTPEWRANNTNYLMQQREEYIKRLKAMKPPPGMLDSTRYTAHPSTNADQLAYTRTIQKPRAFMSAFYPLGNY
jgi:hypothetical protein